MDPRRRALLDTISYAEGTWRGGGSEGYRVMFGGGLADPGRSGRGHPDTVINGGRVSSAAAGRYQFMPDTWKAASQAVGVKPNQFFDPAAQDKAADYLVSRRLGGAQLGDSLTPEIAGKLAPEWASFPTASGGSYYPNQSVKKLGELDSFYRQRLASLRGGGDNSLAATSGGRSQVTADDGSGLMRALLGDDAPEPRKPAASKTRFAAVELSPLGAMEQADPARRAGEALPELTADNDPFVAAMKSLGGPEKPKPVEAPETVIPGVPMPKPGPIGAPTSRLMDGEVGIVDVGKRLQSLGFKVAENPHFGDGRVGKHSPNSHHYDGNALDLTIQPGSPLLAGRKDGDWRQLTSQWGQKLKAAFPDAEIFYPGGDPVGGHDSHIHLAFRGGKGRAAQAAAQLGLI